MLNVDCSTIELHERSIAIVLGIEPRHIYALIHFSTGAEEALGSGPQSACIRDQPNLLGRFEGTIPPE